MIILMIALAVGAAAFGLVAWWIGLLGAVLPGVLAFVVSYFVIARKVGKQVEQAMMAIQKDLQKGRFDPALAQLGAVKRKFGAWQFFLASAMDGQIGSIYYLRQDFDKAKPYLERAFVRHWLAKAMLAVVYFRKKNIGAMNKAFEDAVRYNGKQGLLWSVWAFCHWKLGNEEKARTILVRGKEKLGESDPNLIANLQNLQNEKKMKMRGYGEQWYQFLLETPPAMRQAQGRQVRYVGR